ncbi:MAG: hypothetical protein J5854_00240 [Clostridia bacterium]|nr:hypothetical protein [Clostridia bacterium]
MKIASGWEGVKIILILLVVLTLAGVMIYGFVSSGALTFNEKARKENIKLVSEKISDPWDRDFERVREGSVPEDVSAYIVLHNTENGWKLSGLTAGLNADKKWTAEDLDGVKVVVFIDSLYTSATYSVYVNGNKSGKKTLTRETSTVYFYDVENRTSFAAESLEGDSLPREFTESKSYMISDDTYDELIREKLGLRAAEKKKNGKAAPYIIMGVTIGAAVIGIVGSIIVKKKR